MIISSTAYDTELVLEHYGKKGMKWGQRHAANKASRAKDRVAYDKSIDKARSRTTGTTRAARLGLSDTGSKSHTEFKKAKAQYKVDKQKMGSREARKILNKARTKRITDVNMSQQAKSGKETALVVLGAVGLLSAHIVLNSAARSM